MKRLIFSNDSWAEYCEWVDQDKKTRRRIDKLIQDIDRNGNEGIGKPEPLTGNYSGLWSRRIDEKNRLIYRVDDTSIELFKMKGHYDDN
jgi:toxin YoeB